MKASKNLGISKACPECGKTIIKSVNFEGDGSFETKCVHCGKLVRVGISRRSSVSVTAIVILIAVTAIAVTLIAGGAERLATAINAMQ